MATLAQVVAQRVGDKLAIRLIQDGSVKVNGRTDKSNHLLDMYDVVEFSDQKVCYVGFEFLVDAENDLH